MQLRNRREILLAAAGALGVAATTDPLGASPGNAPLLELSAADAVAQMARGELTAERYAAALIARCNATTKLNAFITFEPERVLEDARNRDRERAKGAKTGPLFGLPIPVKDSVNTAAYRTTAGTPGLRTFRPSTDAPIVATLKNAGALVMGKTNLHELSFGWTSNNLAFGAVHNPYDVTRVPGGSSGGTAAAVAARVAPLGVAEDTEGSIRVPAACCGLAGLRPTTGRYSTEGCVPITPLFDQVGPVARCVRDLALFDSVAADDWRPLRSPALRGLRLAVVRDYFFVDLDPEIAAQTEAALARMQDAGVVLVEATMPDLGRLIELTTYPVQNHDAGIALAQYLTAYGAGIDVEGIVRQASADIRSTFRSDVLPGGEHAVSAEQYSAARFRHLPALRRLYRIFSPAIESRASCFPRCWSRRRPSAWTPRLPRRVGPGRWTSPWHATSRRRARRVSPAGAAHRYDPHGFAGYAGDRRTGAQRPGVVGTGRRARDVVRAHCAAQRLIAQPTASAWLHYEDRNKMVSHSRDCLRTALVLAACIAPPLAQAAAALAAESRDGMVATAQRYASQVGADVLRKGGNAIDAAVAVGYALAVTHPCCGNIGGGGFMVIHLADGRTRSSTSANAHRWRPPPRCFRTPAALWSRAAASPAISPSACRERCSDWRPLARNMAPAAARICWHPAVKLAQDGFTLTRGDVDILDESLPALRSQPNVAAIFLNRGTPFQPGERLTQKDLAATLRAVSEGGAQAFYHGAIAAQVAAAAQANGGLLTARDFAEYSVTEAAPIACSYRGYTVLSAPPPSSGGVVLCEMLAILEAYPLAKYGYHSSESVHVITEAMRHAYHDRNSLLGDPAFVDNPIERLLSPANAAQVRAAIKPHRATPSLQLGGLDATAEHRNTTHYSIADSLGNAVSVTFTINDDFGAKVIAGDTGFFLNDQMDDFTAKPGSPNLFGLVQGSNNAVAPGKRPLSSMSPTLLLKDGKPVLVVGTPGGSRIITTVLQVLLNVIDYGMTLQAAIDAPRLHHQWLPDTLAAEPYALSEDTVAALTRMGYHVVPLEVWGSANAVEAVGIAPTEPAAAAALGFPRPGVMYGASDVRAAAGGVAFPDP